jgi:hypothetical protein
LEAADFLEVIEGAVSKGDGPLVEDVALVSALIVMMKIIMWNSVGIFMVNLSSSRSLQEA